jgi:hypothetical protein
MTSLESFLSKAFLVPCSCSYCRIAIGMWSCIAMYRTIQFTQLRHSTDWQRQFSRRNPYVCGRCQCELFASLFASTCERFAVAARPLTRHNFG